MQTFLSESISRTGLTAGINPCNSNKQWLKWGWGLTPGCYVSIRKEACLMLGMNIYDSDTAAFSATGKTSQTSSVTGFFPLFFFFFLFCSVLLWHVRKQQALWLQWSALARFAHDPCCQVGEASVHSLTLHGAYSFLLNQSLLNLSLAGHWHLIVVKVVPRSVAQSPQQDSGDALSVAHQCQRRGESHGRSHQGHHVALSSAELSFSFSGPLKRASTRERQRGGELRKSSLLSLSLGLSFLAVNIA